MNAMRLLTLHKAANTTNTTDNSANNEYKVTTTTMNKYCINSSLSNNTQDTSKWFTFSNCYASYIDNPIYYMLLIVIKTLKRL